MGSSLSRLLSGGSGGSGQANVVEDLSPQLGSFLDANGNYIQHEHGGNIVTASTLIIPTKLSIKIIALKTRVINSACKVKTIFYSSYEI